MSLDRLTFYEATCDVRLDRDTGRPMGLQQAREALDAWAAAGTPGPETGAPEWHNMGRRCGNTARVPAGSPSGARRDLMTAGWKITPRSGGLTPQTLCPTHRECQ